MEENEARFFVDLVVIDDIGKRLDYDKKDNVVEKMLVQKIIKSKIDECFDISECNYDHYPRQDVINAEILLHKLTEAKKILDLE